MPRPVKWSRDLYPIRERAKNARTETWGRKDIEDLFGVGRATAQMLMRAIGEIQPVGGAHFVERPSLLSFLDVIQNRSFNKERGCMQVIVFASSKGGVGKATSALTLSSVLTHHSAPTTLIDADPNAPLAVWFKCFPDGVPADFR